MDTESRRRPALASGAAALAGLNFLAAAMYAGLAIAAIVAGSSWLGAHDHDPWWPLASLFGLLPVLVIGFGVLAGLVALVALLAGIGTVCQRTWGHVLTWAVAIVALLVGLVWAGGSDFEPLDLVLGSLQVLYGILAIVLVAWTPGQDRRLVTDSVSRV